MRGGITFGTFLVYLCDTSICMCPQLPHLWTVLLLMSLRKKNNCSVWKCELLGSFTEFCKMSPYTEVVKARNCRFFADSPALSFLFNEYMYYIPKPFVDRQRLSCFTLHCETECFGTLRLTWKKKRKGRSSLTCKKHKLLRILDTPHI